MKKQAMQKRFCNVNNEFMIKNMAMQKSIYVMPVLVWNVYKKCF